MKESADDKPESCKCNGDLLQSRKHCVKSRKCWRPSFSTFPKFFSRDLYLRVVITCDCLVKRL